MPSLLEELNSYVAEEDARKLEFERLQQQNRKSNADHRLAENLEKARKAARFAETVALASGNKEYSELFGELGDFGHEVANEGAKGGRRAVSNFAGKKAGKVAQKGADMKLPGNRKLNIKGGMSAGGAAALGGAVSGALQGEGVKGMAAGAFSWWATNIAFGSLFTIVGFIPAIIYLNIHNILNKLGFKFFMPFFIWQKILFWTANILMALALLLVPAIVGSTAYAYCQTWTGWTASKVSGVVGMGDFCKVFDEVVPETFAGGASGGGGNSGTWEGDIVIAITSAYRSGGQTAERRPSAHGRGEAIDIAFRNPKIEKYQSDPRIDRVIDAARRAGFVSPAADVLDEYTDPAANATAGHIHLEFNLKSDGSSYCDNGARVPVPPNDLVNLRDVTGSLEVTAPDPRVRSCMRDAVARFLAELEAESSAATE